MNSDKGAYEKVQSFFGQPLNQRNYAGQTTLGVALELIGCKMHMERS